MPRWLVRLLTAFAAIIAALAALSFIGHLWWIADLAVHFRPQFAFIAALFFLLSWCMRLQRYSAVFLVLWTLHAAPLFPAWLTSESAASSLKKSVAADLSVLFHNVKIDNNNPVATVAAAAAHDADILIFIEASEDIRAAAAARQTDYPHQFPQAGNHQFETVIASKRQLITTVHHFGDLDRFVILAQVSITPDRPITLAIIHPVSPKTAFHTHIRDEHLYRLGVFLRDLPGDVILLGDHNITPWHPLYQDMLKTAGLTNWRGGSFWRASWNIQAPGLTRVPIDLVATRGLLSYNDLYFLTATAKSSDHSPQFFSTGDVYH
ncbi:MAG: endonuclease/exonuclease/phosphatase family protein [Alphaproteobacteria bacterium]|jgi:endonuclease/exonuclease/phosphatase (EEP) superfamily protein YafD|nr:endonuclease/exonuclease/phosphatase family protein [Thalassospira sp.]MCE2964812.1 endonuclease/exonuclease/phosphatase family protein [Alphaproteobacteria bacterium]